MWMQSIGMLSSRLRCIESPYTGSQGKGNSLLGTTVLLGESLWCPRLIGSAGVEQVWWGWGRGGGCPPAAEPAAGMQCAGGGLSLRTGPGCAHSCPSGNLLWRSQVVSAHPAISHTVLLLESTLTMSSAVLVASCTFIGRSYWE